MPGRPSCRRTTSWPATRARKARAPSARRGRLKCFISREKIVLIWLESHIWVASVENLPFCGLAAPNPGKPGKAWMTSAVTAKTTTSFRRDCMSAAETNFSNSTVSLHLSRLFKRNARLLLTLRDINLVFYRLFYTSLAENRICERYRGFHLMRHSLKAKLVEGRTFSCKDKFELPKSWCSCNTLNRDMQHWRFATHQDG